jgi:phage-related protein
MHDLDSNRPLFWVSSAKKDFTAFPATVIRKVGYALHEAQMGLKPLDAKVLKGLGTGVLEIVTNFDTDTFRTVYTVRFDKAVYVLHAFQKKSKTGIATPFQDIELIKRRLKEAEKDYKERFHDES